MTEDYAYKSISAALWAAFSPSSPYYGSGALTGMVSSHSAGGDTTTPQDRIIQAGQVFCLLKKHVIPVFLTFLMIKFMPVDAIGLESSISVVAAYIASTLATQGIPFEFIVDVLRREVRLAPIGSYTRDWPRWLDTSTASVYRAKVRVLEEFNNKLDLIYYDLGFLFEECGVSPNV